MKILAIVHESDAGPGVFLDVARTRGAELCEWRIALDERCPGIPEDYRAVVSLGGSMHAFQRDRHPWLGEEERFLAGQIAAGRPVLGVCLGAQILGRADGGSSEPLPEPEIGWHQVRLTRAGGADPIIGPLGPDFHALQWHECGVEPGPSSATLAVGDSCLQAFRAGPLAWGIQFHAEVTLADYTAWIEQHRSAPDAAQAPGQLDELLARTRREIEGWNSVGRALFGRFLDQAELARAVTPRS